MRTPNPSDKEWVKGRLEDSKELEHSEGSETPTGAGSVDIPGFRLLTSLMKATLFTDFFIHHANIRYAHESAQARVAAAINRSPKFYKWCRGADWAARAAVLVIVIGLLTAIAVGVIIRTFFR